MNIIFNQALVMALLIAILWIGPLCAIGFLRLRKRKARAARRSPLSGQLLREPGHTLRGQVDELRSDLHSGYYEASGIPMMLVATGFAQAHFVSATSMQWTIPTYVAMGVAAIAYLVRKMWKDGRQLDRLRAGLDAEVAVGQELNRLMLQGAIVFHDVPGEQFNLDHVVVCPSGVYAIETKGYTKLNGKGGCAEATVEYDGKTLQFPTWISCGPLEQASRQAMWLSKWLTSAVGTPVCAQPIVALPGWFVKRTGRGDVWVYSGKELVGLPKARGGQVLAPQDVQRIAHQLEQRCRTVAPMLADIDRAI